MVFDYEAYWEARGKTYYAEFHRDGINQTYLENAKRITPYLSIREPRRILDIGCGFGRLTKSLSEAYPGASIVGIDLSEDQIENAKKYLQSRHNVEFICGDFLYHRPRVKYDLITEWACFCHIPPELIHKAVERCGSLLRKKGGYVLIIDIPEGTRMGTASPTPYQWAYDYKTLFKDGFKLLKHQKNYVPKQDLYLFKKVV